MRRMDTFVVRVLGPMADDGEVETSLRGIVEHVASGQSDKFRSADELLSFLRGPRGVSGLLADTSEEAAKLE